MYVANIFTFIFRVEVVLDEHIDRNILNAVFNPPRMD